MTCARCLIAAPIHDAAAKGDLAEVTRLLGAGADAKATTETGDTPLHYAAVAGNLERRKLLVDRELTSAQKLIPVGLRSWLPSPTEERMSAGF